MHCQGTFRRQVIQLQAVLTRERTARDAMKHDAYMDGSGCPHVIDWCAVANLRNLASYCCQASPPALYTSLTMSLRYASMSCTLLGCLSATIATYVVKHCTHVGSCATCHARLHTAVTASPRDAPSSCKHTSMLSGSKSAMSTNSSTWIFFTSFAGTGANASLKGMDLSAGFRAW